MPIERERYLGATVDVLKTFEEAGTIRQMRLNPPTVDGGETHNMINYPMIIAAGEVRVTSMDGTVVRRRGEVSPKMGRVGGWTFVAGSAGVTYYCIIVHSDRLFEREGLEMADKQVVAPSQGSSETIFILCEGQAELTYQRDTLRLSALETPAVVITTGDVVSVQAFGPALAINLWR